jgi:hypothetical protein
MHTGIAHLPLHYGETPRWLFDRMKSLAGQIALWIVQEFGPAELLKKLSDPFWFQALGCALGFDWHSSGLTTTTCGAVKEGIKEIGDLGIFAVGGKGATARKAPDEIAEIADAHSISGDALIYASKLSAKVDNTALQDGYQLYHHTFFFTKEGDWAVVQQGMNTVNRWARRYHWLSFDMLSFVEEPHKAICSDHRSTCLNLIAKESRVVRDASAELAKEGPDVLIREIEKAKVLSLPAHHQLMAKDLKKEYLTRIFIKTYEKQPKSFEELLGISGVGPKTIRALSLISELVYGAKPSFSDPARFSFAHGGKDGTPYRIEREHYDRSIEILKEAINKARLGNRDKMDAIRRLGRL